MEENKNEVQEISTNDIKKETVDTVNQLKDTIKNVDIKKDAKEATGFVNSMFKDPFGTIKQIANDKTNKFLKIAIIFIAIWIISILLDSILTIAFNKYLYSRFTFKRILEIIKDVIAPIISVLALSLIIFIMNNKESKKSLLTTLTSISIAKIPVILASVVNLITLVSSNANPIVSRFSSFCSVVSIILIYFSAKALFEEEQNSKFIKKFVVIYSIYYIVSLVAYYLGIYI